MRLIEVQFGRAEPSGSFVENADLVLREEDELERGFAPLCLVGRNGSGKSHFLQAVAEAFQSAWHTCSPEEERVAHDDGLDFRLRYVLQGENAAGDLLVEIARSGDGASAREVRMQAKRPDAIAWELLDTGATATRELLPSRIVAYTSGDNETLSAPFFASSLEYGLKVQNQAHGSPEEQKLTIPEPRLLLIDYATHLELLVANLLFGSQQQRRDLLDEVRLDDLRTFRCVVQRKGVDLTPELDTVLDKLTACSTAWVYKAATQTYVFDFFVDEATRKGFRTWNRSAFDCYRAFHKLSLLNSLAVPQAARERYKRAVKGSRFAARLPEPPDESKVFRFEQVTFAPKSTDGVGSQVDYVALSDGEHQLVQLLGTFAMIAEPNVLFLLDEPESHFNPLWRIKFLSRILDVTTSSGSRREGGPASRQDALISTHAPFVPSDMPRHRVLIFIRDEDGGLDVRRPEIQTFGASYEEILQSCFDIYPPISQLARDEIAKGMDSGDAEEVADVIGAVGPSVERAILIDHLRELNHEVSDVLPASD